MLIISCKYINSGLSRRNLDRRNQIRTRFYRSYLVHK